MRKLFLASCILLNGLLFTPCTSYAQFFKATSYEGSTSTSITIVLKPDFNFSDKLNEAGFTLQVPKNISGSPNPLPVITVLNNFLATTFPTWSQQSESVSDPDFYNFKFGATAVGTAPVLNVNSGIELQVLELQISGPATAIPLTRLAHLAGGGPLSQYGVAIIDGSLNDRTSYTQMFYGNGVVPAIPAPDELTGFNTYQYVFASGTAPVDFISFSVTQKDNLAELNWVVENESAITSHYEVERSLDGRTFNNIQTVLPQAGANGRKNYSRNDPGLRNIKPSGRIYYRIKQIDADGRFIYTDIRYVELSADVLDITIFPNPVKNDCQVKINLEQEANVWIQVSDAAGKTVWKKTISLNTGLHLINLQTRNWAQGTYYVRIEAGNSGRVLKLLKK